MVGRTAWILLLGLALVVATPTISGDAATSGPPPGVYERSFDLVARVSIETAWEVPRTVESITADYAGRPCWRAWVSAEGGQRVTAAMKGRVRVLFTLDRGEISTRGTKMPWVAERNSSSTHEWEALSPECESIATIRNDHRPPNGDCGRKSYPGTLKIVLLPRGVRASGGPSNRPSDVAGIYYRECPHPLEGAGWGVPDGVKLPEDWIWGAAQTYLDLAGTGPLGSRIPLADLGKCSKRSFTSRLSRAATAGAPLVLDAPPPGEPPSWTSTTRITWTLSLTNPSGRCR